MRISSLVSAITAFLLASGNQLPRGVSPGDAQRYACKSKPCQFVCVSNPTEVLDYSAINDHFCDCDDGSDEPGTPACAGKETTLFYCPNQNSLPKQIYTSRVDDGICDCCDGSDEAHAPKKRKCPNTCAKEAQERKLALERLQSGLAKQNGIKREAQAVRKQWTTELDKLRLEQSDFQKKLKVAKEAENAAYATAESVEKSKCEGCCQDLTAEIDKMKAETVRLRAREVQLMAENAKLIASLGDGVQRASFEAQQASDSVQQVSEYAKWMEAGESLSISGDSNPMTLDVMDNSTRPKEVKLGSDLQEAVDKSKKQQAEIQQAIDKKAKEINAVERRFELIPDDKLGYFSLMDKCLEAKLDGYRYKFCLAKRAHQGSTLLGAFSSWQGEREALFTGGQTCGGGIDRQLLMKFRCAGAEEIVEVTEPRRCNYEAIVHAPGACDREEFNKIQRAKSSVLLPKDEL